MNTIKSLIIIGIICTFVGVAISYALSLKTTSRQFDVYSFCDGTVKRGMYGWNHRVYYKGETPLTDVYVYVNGQFQKKFLLIDKGWIYPFSTWEVSNSSVTVSVVWSGNEETYVFP
jgi:hypothetical protein